MRADKVNQQTVREALGRVRYPGFPRDLVTLGMVTSLDVEGDAARIALRLPGGRSAVPDELRDAVARALEPLGLVAEISVASDAAPVEPTPRTEAAAPAAAAAAARPPQAVELPGVRTVLAVSSAKGGVGKSTVATNLACALAQAGMRIGLLDADVYGPSLPTMMGTEARPRAAGGNRFHPVVRHGVSCTSMGFFLDDTSPVIWRGPMVSGLIRQFLNDCVWGELDVLVIDLPPGTGDAQLTLVQQVRLSGAIIVTTPQDVALRDVLRGAAMFRQVQVPILGVVENMSLLACPSCGEHDDVFGTGGGEQVAEAVGAPLLARIPIEIGVRESGDAGLPIVCASPDSEVARVLAAVAERVAVDLGVLATEPRTQQAR